MNEEHLAKEAQRLLHDEVLLKAIASAQKDAMDGLVTVKADDTIEIQRLQARVLAFDEILANLEAMVLRQVKQGDSSVA
jgi:hypothetical protein